MKTLTPLQEDLVRKVRDGLLCADSIVVSLTELDPVFGDEDHRFERVLQLHDFATACDAECEMASHQGVRFRRRRLVRAAIA